MTRASLERWRTRVGQAREAREAWEVRYGIRRLELMYLGLDPDEEVTPIARRHFNHFFATMQTQMPALLAMQTNFIAKQARGRKLFSLEQAKLIEGLLRTIAEQDDNLFVEASLALLQAFFRVGVLKAAYEPRLEVNPRYGEEGEQPAEGLEPEPERVLTDEVYHWEWVDARHILFPADGGPNMRRWGWIGEEVEVTLDEAKEDERFRHRRQLRANVRIDDGVREEEDVEERFSYVELWDHREKRQLIYADGQDFDDWLMHEPLPAGVEDDPYAILSFVPIVGPEPGPWPKPVCFDWMPLQEDYDALRAQQINAAQRAARKFLYDGNTFADEEELDKFTSPADMQGVRIVDMGRPPQMFGEASQNIDVARNVPLLINDWRLITGATATRLGMADADTATEAVLVEQAASLRESAGRVRVDKWLATAGRKMLQLVRQTLTLDMWIQLRGFSEGEFKAFLQRPEVRMMLALQVGEEHVGALLAAIELNPQLQERFRERFGRVKPLQVTRSMLTFEADVGVLPGASRPLQRAQLLQLVQTIGPLALSSPTFVEELLASFELPQGARIAEELMINMRRMQQQMQDQGQGQAPQAGTRSPQQRNGRMNPLGAVGG